MLSQTLSRSRIKRHAPGPLVHQAMALLAARPFLSVLLSVLGFSFFGPLAALILVATMLDHEFAHQWVMRRLGYQPDPVRVIPLMGAFVRARMPMLRSADIAIIYLAGPIAGVLSAACAALIAHYMLPVPLQQQVYCGASLAIALNLFNLIPIEPLDGGLISRIVPFQALGLFPPLLAILLFYEHVASSPAGLTLLAGASVLTLRKVQHWRRYLEQVRRRLSAGDIQALRESRATFDVPMRLRVIVVLAYVLLVPASIALLTTLFPASGLW